MVQKLKTTKDVLQAVASGLRQKAIRPDIYGYNPHLKQLNFHSSDAQGRLFIGGNRSGKTVGGATECIWWLTGQHPFITTPNPPVRLRAVSVDFKYGVEKIVKPEIARWIPPSQLIKGSWEESYDKDLKTLTLDNGSFIEFMSYEQDLDKFSGTSRHGVWFDEEPPEDIFIECKLRLVDTGGRWWITMTPVEGMTWVFDEIYEKGKSGLEDIHITEVEMSENPTLGATEIEAVLSGLSEDDRKAREKGQFVQIGGLIYKQWNPEIHVVDSFMPPVEWMQVAAMDHGINNPTAWGWACVTPDGDIIFFDEHVDNDKTVRYHAQIVHEKNQFHRRVPEYYVGDPAIKQREATSGISVQQEYIEFGVPIIPGNNDVSAGIARVQRYLEGKKLENGINKPKLYVTRNCVNIQYEFGRYRWATWQNKKMTRQRNRKEEPNKKHDHCMDLIRYLIASRPDYDDGTYILQPSQPLPEATTAINAYNRIDEDLVEVSSRPAHVDFHLGEEY